MPIILLFSAQLQSSPTASNLFLVGSAELGKTSYEITLDTQFKQEKAHTIQYEGTARLKSEAKGLEIKPATLYVTKTDNPKVIISILMSGDSGSEGLFLELVAEGTILNSSEGDLLEAEANLMWMITSPYRDLSETTFINRDSGEAQLEILEAN